MTQEEFFNRYKYDRTKDRIGSGGFGNVYKVFDTTENETVALKIAEVKQGQESLSLLKEVELASSLKRHVNIARYTACYRFDLPNGHFDFGILQYYPLGNLSQLVKSKKLTQIEKEQIAKGVISGIQHLHNNNIVHRDLKSANILIAGGYQGEYVPKIADFGLSKQFAENENSYFSNSFAGGSLLYVAPEQLEGKELRKNVDLWSLGVVLFELFVGDTPFRANLDDGSERARAEIIQKIRSSSLPASITNIPSPWQEIIRVCFVTNPSNRIKSIEEVQDIVNGKATTKKDSHRTEVDTESKLDTTSVDSYINNENRNESANGKSISLLLVYLLIIMALGYVVWKGLEGKLGGNGVMENSEINKPKDQINISKPNEEDIWQEVISKNVESAYSRYLFLYPTGKYAEEAKLRKNDLGESGKIIGGLEDQLVSYLENQNLPLDKNLWFKFDRLQFDTGKASLQSSSQDQLKYIANIMMSFPKVKLRISGFTDNLGDPVANKKLSTDRAYNVMNELINLGVAKNRLSSEGWGDMYPITENDTEEGRRANRRVAIRVTEK